MIGRSPTDATTARISLLIGTFPEALCVLQAHSAVPNRRPSLRDTADRRCGARGMGPALSSHATRCAQNLLLCLLSSLYMALKRRGHVEQSLLCCRNAQSLVYSGVGLPCDRPRKTCYVPLSWYSTRRRFRTRRLLAVHFLIIIPGIYIGPAFNREGGVHSKQYGDHFFFNI